MEDYNYKKIGYYATWKSINHIDRKIGFCEQDDVSTNVE